MLNFINQGLNDVSNFFWDVIMWCVNTLTGGLGGVVQLFFEMFNLSISIDVSVYSTLREIMIGVGYIVPIRALLPIPVFMISFYLAQFVFAIFRFICSTFIRKVSIVS